MCLSSTEPGGPRRCSSDARTAYQRASSSVAELVRAETQLEAGLEPAGGASDAYSTLPGGAGGSSSGWFDDEWSVERDQVHDAYQRASVDDGYRGQYRDAVIEAGAEVAYKVELSHPLPPEGAEDQTWDAVLQARALAYRDTLAEIRSFGTAELATQPGSYREGVEMARQQSGYFPDEWVQATNRPPYKPLIIKEDSNVGGISSCYRPATQAPMLTMPLMAREAGELTDGLTTAPEPYPHVQLSQGWAMPLVEDTPELRARLATYRRRRPNVGTVASDRPGFVYVGQDIASGPVGPYASLDRAHRDPAVMLHELSHRMAEHNHAVTLATETFLQGRVVGQRRKRYVIGGDTWYRDGGFADVAVGIDYPDHSRNNVLSMGMEALFHRKYGGLEGAAGHNPDTQHRNLILGLLAFSPGDPRGAT
ncbi:hypothetical protein [Mycolicibacterium alvei]|uniref:Uncharacterized protein n=1 Tax=Mycolicibacterium alvei TaxID=67081 RepID=A0A6N4V2W7_9MYCO|nr:hypothetical protein [Mycolicibacterium alvei]MCV7003580.1 hypothetical protein [Mycolicibacterium alvei]BBX30463.1 hypothetical protein MALV_55880 [Mycolicibacterium alvei]